MADLIRDDLGLRITEYESKARLLKHELNALAPISAMPLEILTNIFSVATQIEDDNSRLSQRFWQVYSTHLTITQVCHTWRDVALKYPLMWCEIRFVQPDCIEEFFRRSENASLSVVVSSKDRQTSRLVREAITNVLAHLGRIRKLSLSQPPKEDWSKWRSKVMPLLNRPAPLLQDLSLEGYSSERFITLPASIFLGEVPKLQALTLKACNFNWTHFLLSLSSLTHLAIINPSNSFTVHQLITSLSAMSALKSLDLQWCTITGPSARLNFPDRFLPTLTKLTLADTSRKCSFLLSWFPISPRVSIDLRCTDPPLADDSVLRPFLLNLWRRSDKSPIQHIQEMTLNSHFMYQSVKIEAIYDSSTCFNLELGVISGAETPNWRDSLAWNRRVVSMLLHTLPIKNLRKLTTHLGTTQDNCGPNYWSDGFLPCTQLKEIAFVEDSRQLAMFMSTPDQSQAISSTPFPALERLRVYDLDLDAEDFASLMEYLERRKDIGLPLKVFHLDRCGGKEEEEVIKFVDDIKESGVVEELIADYTELDPVFQFFFESDSAADSDSNSE